MSDPPPFCVLVVDDDPDTRENLRDILELDGYHVEAVGSAAEALAPKDWGRCGAIVLDRKQILPCAVRLEGEYGIRGLFVGVPAKLGAGGAEQIIELDLTDDERTSLRRSADSVKELVGVMGI